MKQDYGISGGALAAALLGMLFCIWTALGNEVAFCVTAGCSLYQDLVIGGLSMWWIGTAAFGVLAQAELSPEQIPLIQKKIIQSCCWALSRRGTSWRD